MEGNPEMQQEDMTAESSSGKNAENLFHATTVYVTHLKTTDKLCSCIKIHKENTKLPRMITVIT
jgi:hypothetical protein